MFPPGSKGGFRPILYKDSVCTYGFPFPYGMGNGKNKTMLWPTTPYRSTGTLLYGEEANVAYAALHKTLVDCLQKLFSSLFADVTLIAADDGLGFQLAQYEFNPEKPGFKLTKPKKAEIQESPFYKSYYNPGGFP